MKLIILLFGFTKDRNVLINKIDVWL